MQISPRANLLGSASDDERYRAGPRAMHWPSFLEPKCLRSGFASCHSRQFAFSDLTFFTLLSSQVQTPQTWTIIEFCRTLSCKR